MLYYIYYSAYCTCHIHTMLIYTPYYNNHCNNCLITYVVRLIRQL